MCEWTGKIPISYLFYALRKRSYGYFNLNFCREEQLQTTSFLRQAKRKQTPALLALVPQRHLHIFWHCRSTQSFWNNVSQWTSKNLDLTNLNISPFSPALCLGLIDNISNLLLHHFLLIARRYIYEIPFLRYKCTLSQSYAPWKSRNRLFLIIITQPPLGRNGLLSNNTPQKQFDLYR